MKSIDLGLFKPTTKVAELWDKIISNEIDTSKRPSEIVKELWSLYNYLPNHERSNNTNGAMFEMILGFVLVVKGVKPFYFQTQVSFVPNVEFDFVLFDERLTPWTISAKTSLRERWKQADLESFALKNVFRNAQSYLINLDETESSNLNNKIENKGALGLEKSIYARSIEFDQLIEEMSVVNWSEAPIISAIVKGKEIGTTLA